MAEPAGGTRAIFGKCQVEPVPVIPTDQWEVSRHPADRPICDRIDGWVIARLVVPFRPAIIAVVEVNVGTGMRRKRVGSLEGMSPGDLVEIDWKAVGRAGEK
jgi:hypothetical protein